MWRGGKGNIGEYGVCSLWRQYSKFIMYKDEVAEGGI